MAGGTSWIWYLVSHNDADFYDAERTDALMTQTTAALIVIDDLFFLAKVRTTVEHLHWHPMVLTRSAAIQAYLQNATPPPVVAIVDLSLRADDAIAIIRTIRSMGSSVPVLAFGAHVAVESRKQALQAGAEQVVTKAEFSQNLPALLQPFVP